MVGSQTDTRVPGWAKATRQDRPPSPARPRAGGRAGEAKFGEAKTRHGLRRCRNIGMLAFQVQSYLTAIALNMKRIVLLLTGATFGHSLPAPAKA